MSRRKAPSNAKRKRANDVRSSPYQKVTLWLAVPFVVGYVALYVYQQYYSKGAPDTSVEIDPFYDPEIRRDKTLFDIVDIPGKGKGCIAVRDIKQGELVIREKPLTWVPTSTSDSPEALISYHLSTLTPSERSALFNLTYVDIHLPPSYPETRPMIAEKENEAAIALAILRTNSVAAGPDHAGLFPRMARINHGCVGSANVVYHWRDEDRVLVVRALKDIKTGDELLSSYTDSRKPRFKRQLYLLENYDFDCACPVCSLPDDLSKTSDTNLLSMMSHYDSFGSWAEGNISGKEAISHAREAWRLGDEEGYWSGRGMMAGEAAWVAAAHSDEEATRQWTELALKWFLIELGDDSPQAIQSQDILSRGVKTHFAWGDRKEEIVGGPFSEG